MLIEQAAYANHWRAISPAAKGLFAAAGFVASFAKFAGIFALTQIPLAISEGLLTVVIFNALARFNPQELQDMKLLPAGEAQA